MSTSGSSSNQSASEAAKTFFSKTHVIYIFNFIQNLILASVVTAIYTTIMVNNGQTPVSVPIDLQSMTNFSYNEVVTNLDYAFNLPKGQPSVIMVPDAKKSGYSIDTLRKFLNETGPINVSYRLEAFDCDDFAYTLMGKEREWFGLNSPQDTPGSTFGWISGDLRLDNENDVVGHAMNVFIDNYGQVWLIEPQNYNFYKASQLSNQSFVDFILM